jgi:serine/threonine protein kinase
MKKDKILKNVRKLLGPGFKIESEYAAARYQLGQRLGEGGFGVAYHAVEQKSGFDVCLKVTADQASWHQEAYFGKLLAHSSRAIQLYDCFPYLIQLGATQYPVFVLVFEYAANGEVGDYLDARGPWPERRARREVGALLQVLTELHAGGAMHRDITPMNVLVDSGGRLKLADFGIARQELLSHKVPADVFNWGFVSRLKIDGGRRHWLMADDVFQMGQLLAMLVTGDPSELVGLREIRHFECSEELKDILRKAIGPRAQRYESAYEMLLALEGQEVESTPVRTLKDKNVVFTGPLSIKRHDATLLVSQSGGTVHSSVTPKTHVLVIGQRSKLYKGKIKGTKIKAAEALNQKGAKIRFINEPQFMRLVR